jgi:hypothetical protein
VNHDGRKRTRAVRAQQKGLDQLPFCVSVRHELLGVSLASASSERLDGGRGRRPVVVEEACQALAEGDERSWTIGGAGHGRSTLRGWLSAGRGAGISLR